MSIGKVNDNGTLNDGAFYSIQDVDTLLDTKVTEPMLEQAISDLGDSIGDSLSGIAQQIEEIEGNIENIGNDIKGVIFISASSSNLISPSIEELNEMFPSSNMQRVVVYSLVLYDEVVNSYFGTIYKNGNDFTVTLRDAFNSYTAFGKTVTINGSSGAIS